MELLAETNSFCGLIQLIVKYHPDVVIMDLHMPDENKVSVAETKSALSGCSLVAISIWNDGETKARADAFGACRLLDKRLLAAELIPAIHECAKE